MKKCITCGAEVQRATCPTCGAVQPAKTYSDGTEFPWGRVLVVVAVALAIAAGVGYWVYAEVARAEAAQEEAGEVIRRQAAASEKMKQEMAADREKRQRELTDVYELSALRARGDAAAWRAEAIRRGWEMCPACGWTGRVGNGEQCAICGGLGCRRPEQK